MTRSGVSYERPTSAHPTVEPESSSLLRTPTAQLAINGGSQHPDKRKAGGHGPTLADEVEHLLPTPRATDGTKGGPNQRGSSGDQMLPSAVQGLLPTPRATRGGSGTETVALLPTPAVNDMGEGKTPEAWDEWTAKMQTSHANGNGHGKSLAIEAMRLLPTPTSQAAKHAADDRGPGTLDDANLWSVVTRINQED